MAVTAAKYNLYKARVGEMIAEYLEVSPAARVLLYFFHLFYTLFFLPHFL